MPHPESEHSLKAQLACALKETEDVNALRLKQDAELIALRAEARRLETAARAYIEGHELALSRAEAAESALAAAHAACDEQSRKLVNERNAANARADRLEDAARRAVNDLNEERWKASGALAAARRECDLWKQIAGDLYAPLEERGFRCDGDHINVCGTFGSENCPLCITAAALGAPAAAAGEDSK